MGERTDGCTLGSSTARGRCILFTFRPNRSRARIHKALVLCTDTSRAGPRAVFMEILRAGARLTIGPRT